MTLMEFAEHYPRLYHMANQGSWATIQAWGLLSTTALLDKFEINGDQRHKIESCHRARSIEISHPKYGKVVIRDQAPMRPKSLEACLTGLSPRQWYELLNRKAFFWVSEARIDSLLNARLYRNRIHTVITLDTMSLLGAHCKNITLSPINSGSTLYVPQQRGTQTFRPISTYPFDQRRKARGLANAVAEVAVDYSVPDLLKHTLMVELRRGPDVIELLYERTRRNGPSRGAD